MFQFALVANKFALVANKKPEVSNKQDKQNNSYAQVFGPKVFFFSQLFYDKGGKGSDCTGRGMGRGKEG